VTHITTTCVVVDVPVLDDRETVMAYAAELGQRAAGYSQFYYNGGRFYSGTEFYEHDTVRDGWQESPWQARTPLYSRLWNALLDDLLCRSDGYDVATSIATIAKALADNTPSEFTGIWGSLRRSARNYKTTPTTEEDLEDARTKAARVLQDVVIYRRQMHLRTGQPCYVVRSKQGKVRVAIETTEVHACLRRAAFDNPVVFPAIVSGLSIDDPKYFFPIEDHDAMLAFIEAAGDNLVGRVPRASRHRWASHDESVDAIEIDRIARIAVHETAVAAMAQMPSLLLGGRREFFEPFYNLKGFLDRRLDPDDACEETARKLGILCAVATDGTKGPPLLDARLQAFFSRGLSRTIAVRKPSD
jgi:hypothetical protein